MNQQGGYTLIEISLVLAIVGIVTAVAIPSFNNNDPHKLEIAAEEIARAINFAREESRRTGISHGVETFASSEQLRVFRLPSLFPVFDIRHPLNKKLYKIQLKTDPFVAGVDMVSASFNYESSISSPNYLRFNSQGMPIFTIPFNPTNFMLIDATITLAYDNQQKVISVAPMTGRVTVQ